MQKQKQSRIAGSRRSARAGFSLLEVLMATTVLIVIVVMVALVYQQARVAWTAGTLRAESDTILRSAVGTIERDLGHAIDASFFQQKNDYYNPSGTCLEFVTLDGTNRVPLWVRYDYTGVNLTRQWCPLGITPGTTNWAKQIPLQTSELVSPNFSLTMCTFTAVRPPAGVACTNLPLRVDIEAHLEKQGTYSFLSGYSAGAGKRSDDVIQVNP